MKRKIQEKWVSPLLRKPALAMTAAAAFALSGNVAHALAPGPPPAATPEVATWFIGAGVLAMVAIEFLRRKFAHKKLRGSN